MKKSTLHILPFFLLTLTLISSVFLTACNKQDLAANLTNYNLNSQPNVMITLTDGLKININDQINQILAGNSFIYNDKTIQAKLMIKNKETNAIELVNFPSLELKPVKNTDIFEIPEELVYKDENNNLIWEKDGTKSGLLTYTEAQEYCANFGTMSFNKPFSIPAVAELKTILKNNDAHIDTNIFKNLNDTYWTQHEFAYSFYYNDGILVDKEKGLAYVRCVLSND